MLNVPPRVTQAYPTRLDRGLLLLLALYGLFALAALALVPSRFLPAEDAVILFQYSRNLAQHGAITFLAGGPHVEGATDFAWMAIVAAAIRCGIPPFWFCAVTNVLSLLALATLLLRLAGLKPSILSIFAIAGSAALFPQILAAASGFAVLPDAVLLMLVVFFIARARILPASVSALTFCLFRPDGIVFAAPLLLYAVLQEKSKSKSIAAVLTFFILPGIAYFLWRWHYFGELFPLPFLVKSDAARVLGLFVARSVRTSLIFVVFTATLLVPLKFLKTHQRLWLILPLIVIPTAFYWMMRLDQNVGARFFYYLPLSTAILIALSWSALQRHRVTVFRTAFVAWLLLLAMPLWRELRTFRDEQFQSSKNIAEALGRLPQHGSILTSEAGFLPYFSAWTTYDAWGLNTPEFAHHFFQTSDVERLHADLIVLHPDRPESCILQPNWNADYPDRTWPHLTRNLIIGAAPAYELWLTSYGSEYYRQRKHWQYGEGDRECWLIRKDSPLHAAIARILQNNHGVSPQQSAFLEQAHAQLTR
jgi:hypothetical protein